MESIFQLSGLTACSLERYSALRSIEIQSFFTELSSRFDCRGVHEYYSYEAVYPSLW